MPRSKKKAAPEGVQWAPISTPDHAPTAFGAPPTSTSGASPSPSSEAPSLASAWGNDVPQASDPRVQPSTAPTSHHHHYIPTPTSSGRGTPTSAHAGTSHGLPVSNYGAGPSHGRPSFPAHDHHQQTTDPSSFVLPSIESPDWTTTGRHTPIPIPVYGDQHHCPPSREPFRFSKYSQPPRPPTLPLQQQQPAAPTHRSSPSQAHAHAHAHTPTALATSAMTTPAPPPPPRQHHRRGLNDDEVRRLQRFMSLNWRVGVINHPPFARRSNNNANNHGGPAAAAGDHGTNARPVVAGFVGQGGPGPGFSLGRPRPR